MQSVCAAAIGGIRKAALIGATMPAELFAQISVRLITPERWKAIITDKNADALEWIIDVLCSIGDTVILPKDAGVPFEVSLTACGLQAVFIKDTGRALRMLKKCLAATRDRQAGSRVRKIALSDVMYHHGFTELEGPFCSLGCAAFCGALKQGALEVLDYMGDSALRCGLCFCKRPGNVMRHAVCSGKVASMQWVVSRGCIWDDCINSYSIATYITDAVMVYLEEHCLVIFETDDKWRAAVREIFNSAVFEECVNITALIIRRYTDLLTPVVVTHYLNYIVEHEIGTPMLRTILEYRPTVPLDYALDIAVTQGAWEKVDVLLRWCPDVRAACQGELLFTAAYAFVQTRFLDAYALKAVIKAGRYSRNECRAMCEASFSDDDNLKEIVARVERVVREVQREATPVIRAVVPSHRR